MNQDPLTFALLGQAVVIIGILVKIIRDQHLRRQDAASREERVESADREHLRLDRATREVEARTMLAVSKLDEDLKEVWARLQILSTDFNIGLGKTAVIEERTRHLDDGQKRIEGDMRRVHEKLDALLNRAPS